MRRSDGMVFSWMGLFDALSAVEDLAIAQFDVTTLCPLSFPEYQTRQAERLEPLLADAAPDHSQYYAMDDLQLVKRFGYARLSRDRYYLEYYYKPNMARLCDGGDLAAYERFMGKVRATSEKK